MGKVKLKDIEGNPKDIQFLLKENDVSLWFYLAAEPFRKQVNSKWIFTIVIILFVLSCCIWIEVFNSVWMKVSTLAVFFLSFLILLITYSNYRSTVITTILTAALIVNILVILKVYSPQEVTKKIETIISKNTGEK